MPRQRGSSRKNPHRNKLSVNSPKIAMFFICLGSLWLVAFLFVGLNAARKQARNSWKHGDSRGSEGIRGAVRAGPFKRHRLMGGGSGGDNRGRYRGSGNDSPLVAADSYTTLLQESKSILIHLPSRERPHPITPITFFVGAIRDAAELPDETFQYMVTLACQHGINIHMVVGTGEDELRERFKYSLKNWKRIKESQDRHNAGDEKYHSCARFYLLRDPADLSMITNRVERIAYVRDLQRQHLRLLRGNGHVDDIIVVVDLDLISLPPLPRLVDEIDRMRKHHHTDVLCSAGIMNRPYGYYDLYSTVLLDGTFLYPVRHRLLDKIQYGENPNLIRANDDYGVPSSWDILDWLEKKGSSSFGPAEDEYSGRDEEGEYSDSHDGDLAATVDRVLEGVNGKSEVADPESKLVPPILLREYERHRRQYVSFNSFGPSTSSLFSESHPCGDDSGCEHHMNPVQVNSCFGGLAIYFASKFLDSQCYYHLPVDGAEFDRLLRFANFDDKRPCEHVVFHDCLKRIDPTTNISIQPDLRTVWNNVPSSPFQNLVSESNQDSLITHFNQHDRGDRLISKNGLHVLKINANGELVIESCGHSSPSTAQNCWWPEIRWRAIVDGNFALTSSHESRNGIDIPWSHLFLILERSGNLALVKQVPKENLHRLGLTCNRQSGDSCQDVIWTSGSALPDPSDCKSKVAPKCYQRFTLQLSDQGVLEIHEKLDEQKTTTVIWKSE